MSKIHCPRALRGTGVFMWLGYIEGDSLYELAFDTTPFAFSLNGGSNWGKQMFMVYVNSGPGFCANFFMHKFAHLYKASTTCILRLVMSHAKLCQLVPMAVCAVCLLIIKINCKKKSYLLQQFPSAACSWFHAIPQNMGNSWWQVKTNTIFHYSQLPN